MLFLENIYKALLEDKQRSSVGMFDVHINIHLFKHQITPNKLQIPNNNTLQQTTYYLKRDFRRNQTSNEETSEKLKKN